MRTKAASQACDCSQVFFRKPSCVYTYIYIHCEVPYDRGREAAGISEIPDLLLPNAVRPVL